MFTWGTRCGYIWNVPYHTLSIFELKCDKNQKESKPTCSKCLARDKKCLELLLFFIYSLQQSQSQNVLPKAFSSWYVYEWMGNLAIIYLYYFMTRKWNLLDDQRNPVEISENLSNTIFLASYLARENQNSGLQESNIWHPESSYIS